MRKLTHIALAALFVLPSLAAPGRCSVAGPTEDTQESQKTSCCADSCTCPADSGEEPVCAGAACAQAPSEPGDTPDRAAALPAASEWKPLPTVTVQLPALIGPPPPCNESRPLATAGGSSGPPGKRLLTLCALLI